MRLEDLRPELQTRAKDCKTSEERLALAKEEGVELSDEDLDQIAGGWGDSDEDTAMRCLECGSTNLTARTVRGGESNFEEFSCNDCGYFWSQQF